MGIIPWNIATLSLVAKIFGLAMKESHDMKKGFSFLYLFQCEKQWLV